MKEKLPVLTGLGAAILVSFVFSTCATLRGLSHDQEVLSAALGRITKDVLGEQTEDPERATELLEKNKLLDEADPMPHMDGFDVAVELSNAVPMSITHDVEEFDVQRGHVKISGLVGSTADAQQISAALQAQRCFKDVKISKVTQAINTQRQKYVLELDIKCPEDAAKKKPVKSKEGEKE